MKQLSNIADELSNAIRAVLTPDLVRPKYRGHADNPMFGHCYVATEALFHFLGGLDSDYRAVRGKDETGDVHWWLEHKITAERYDITADQFYSVGRAPPYAAGVPGPFLTKQPSKRAQLVMTRVKEKFPALVSA